MQDRLVNVLYWQEAENDNRAIAEAVYKKRSWMRFMGWKRPGYWMIFSIICKRLECWN